MYFISMLQEISHTHGFCSTEGSIDQNINICVPSVLQNPWVSEIFWSIKIKYIKCWCQIIYNYLSAGKIDCMHFFHVRFGFHNSNQCKWWINTQTKCSEKDVRRINLINWRRFKKVTQIRNKIVSQWKYVRISD